MYNKLKNKFNEITTDQWSIIGIAAVASLIFNALVGPALGSLVVGAVLGLALTNHIKVD